MKGNFTATQATSVPYPPRMADAPTVTADLEALVQRSFVQSLMQRVMSFQEKDYGGNVKVDWQAGTYYTGVFAAYLATGEPAFREAAIGWGNAAKWKIGPRPFYADDLCMGQTMLDLYLVDRNPAYVKDLISVMKAYFGKKVLTANDVHSHQDQKVERPMRGRDLWWWCDALYMAPPVLARMHAATGEQRYLDLLHDLYWDAYDFLFDVKSSLFFRDADFIPADRDTVPESDKRFWSRGNGWVYAGLVRVLEYLPENDPYRARYLDLFQRLTRKLVTLQRTDGLWNSWLNRPDLEQSPEVSGSSFFTYGLLAGVRRGWLDRRSYLPVALRAWRGLTAKLGTDGRLGFAQLVDSAPGPVRPESSIDYTHGAFLLVASELYTLDLSLANLMELEPAQQPKLMLTNASWTHLKDARAVIADEHIYLGGVDREGDVRFYAYRIDPINAPGILLETDVLAQGSCCDERRHPAFLRFDGKLLSVYPSDEESTWNRRLASIPENLPTWGPMPVKWSGENRMGQKTAASECSSLARLLSESGRIFHFAGSQVTWSDDGAETWQEAVRFLNVDDVGLQTKCADNGEDRIDLVFTDGGSLHHVYYHKGAFHSSAGRMLGTLEKAASAPIQPTDATRIYEGIVGIEDLGYDSNGRPVVVFGVSLASGGFEYRIARWDELDGQWECRFLAFAGSGEGGVSLDPDNDRIVYLSTDADPATGAPNATGRYQLYRGNQGEDLSWEQLTFDVNRDNLRPFVPRGHGAGACVLWLRGIHRSHSDYQMDVYGIMDAGSIRLSERTPSGLVEVENGEGGTDDYADSPLKRQVASRLREAV
ncbi:MAG: glycoside hydrolase family 88 protein [Akkermansiaceae bacterium]